MCTLLRSAAFQEIDFSHTEQKKMLREKKNKLKIFLFEAAYTKHPDLEVNC